MLDNVVDRSSIPAELTKWDSAFTKRFIDMVRPAINAYFRAEVRDLEHIPASGPVLLVSNHSGGMLTPDVPVFGPAYYHKFGYTRPLYTLAHYGIFIAPWGPLLPRLGVVHASPENATCALHAGGLVLVFPGGDYDAFRPTLRQNVIDFNGRTGYAKTAIETGVPIVPIVSIGAQETQLFLARGDELAYRLGLRRLRMDILPITFGFPFGFSTTLLPNFPLPSKIVMEVLEPIEPAAFGKNPDVDEVDDHVRRVMQRALNRLARERRLPVLG